MTQASFRSGDNGRIIPVAEEPATLPRQVGVVAASSIQPAYADAEQVGPVDNLTGWARLKPVMQPA